MRTRSGVRRFLALSVLLVAVVAAPAEALASSSFLNRLSRNALLGDSLDRALLVSPGPISNLQPGAAVRSQGGQCSFNFLFQGGDGRRYMGTAGHCILGNDGERSWQAGSGPVARDSLGRRVGEFAYAVHRSSTDLDFALVRLDGNVRALPRLPQFGGPSGISNERVSTPVLLHYCGSGVAVGTLVSCRSGIALSMGDPNHIYMEGLSTFGDSGGPVVTASRRAVGLIVTLGLHLDSIGTEGLDAGLIRVVRLRPQLQRAERALSTNLRLING